MYVRFHSPALVRRGVNRGLFRPAYNCLGSSELPEVLRTAIQLETDWFEENLPLPGSRAFCVKSRKRWRSHGICWFVDSAREQIAHAFALASLLRECGIPVTKIATDIPGQILYRDAYQVVAKPAAATPTVWH